MPSLLFLHILTLFVLLVQANVEKVVFIAQPSIPILDIHPTLDDLDVLSLHPHHLQEPASLPVSFSAPDNSSWYLLENLRIGQRFEVRVCWPATYPTKIDVDVLSISEVLQVPELIQSLVLYSENRDYSCIVQEPVPELKHTSKHFLRIQASPEYISPDTELMLKPYPVPVDIILDPYLLNILPASLVPTGVYICVTGLLSWFVAKKAYSILSPRSESTKPHVD
ncbi:hypothetical protein P152DRAFT_73105 [Eremomyces bilateralis CBS 781.70]|uniref:GPI transamidase component PIG-T n=1 Tax=Eremomyces bilateralis CBS 781.70 TaxID=1392243 RepID=A0A6G1FZ61_9PEZI|nr:uncharacterized protein P152DRAFT_73105 [Eremomyces bilateralis CBS 781.70]KAF1810981.1 hypothetical protein P152DRAFT_73105 [Eremomyces bilateralis CBS 781.70]